MFRADTGNWGPDWGREGDYPMRGKDVPGIISSMSVVLNWNGKDVPQELRALPEGRYVVESVDAIPELSMEEDAGLEAGLKSLRQGLGIDADAVFHRIGQGLRR
jgi:hypothetical protein